MEFVEELFYLGYCLPRLEMGAGGYFKCWPKKGVVGILWLKGADYAYLHEQTYSHSGGSGWYAGGERLMEMHSFTRVLRVGRVVEMARMLGFVQLFKGDGCGLDGGAQLYQDLFILKQS